MADTLVNKLLESFDELERCITVTQEVLAQREGVPGDVVSRVNQYSGIVAKQRELAFDLKRHISTQNWDEVARHVRLINGLSSMIRDDAQAILSGTYAAGDSEKDNQLV